MVGGPGYLRLGPDPRLRDWARAALPAARVALAAGDDWRCGSTWFVGVDALPNGPDGAMGGVAFPWDALPLTPVPLHPAQLSVIRPGYPRPSPGETDAAFRFRSDRDGAHLDGLIATGPDKRRRLQEPHAWVLGLPLNACGPGASPLVVWEGSHAVIGPALRAAFGDSDPATWDQVDVTDAYRDARAQVFRTCRRVELPVRPGEATLLHRQTIHGVAPWAAGAQAPREGRMIAYFRPLMASVRDWAAETGPRRPDP